MRVVTLFFAALLAAASARAQTPGAPAPSPAPPGQVTVCGQPVAAPETPPPAGSGPVVFKVVLCFEKQGGYPVLEANAYLYYIQLRPSAGGEWVPFDESTEHFVRDDFKRLWATNFLDDLTIDVHDFPSKTASSARSSSTTWRSDSGSRLSTTSGRTRSISRKSKKS